MWYVAEWHTNIKYCIKATLTDVKIYIFKKFMNDFNECGWWWWWYQKQKQNKKILRFFTF